MSLFFIAFDNRSPSSGKLITMMESLGAKQVLKPLWVLRSDRTADILRDILKPHLGAEDGLMIIEERDWSGLRTFININSI